jgi:hypothetical protein
MKTTLPEPDGPAREPAAPQTATSVVVREWNRFWFTPADPTLLGLIRIATALVTFYTLVAYTFELQALIGENAWIDLRLRQAQFRESPVPPVALDWTTYPVAPPPQTEEEKRYWDAYLNKWKMPPPGPYPQSFEEGAHIEEYKARWGVDPRIASGQGRYFWSVWLHVTDPTEMLLIHLAFCAICFLFLIGFCTRVTSVLTWFATLCYTHRAAGSLFGVDTMMNILLIYLAIGPSGAALSVDRLIARWWARAKPRVLARWRAFWGRGTAEEVTPAPAPFPAEPAPSVSANVAIRLLQIHVCLIYLSAGLSKLQGVSWWTGNAVWLTLANFEFAPMQHEMYVDLVASLAENRFVYGLTMTAAGIFTLAFEIGYIFLVWRPSTRWLVLTGAVILHGFIGLFMGLKTFSLMMLAMNMAFLTPEMVRWLLGYLPGGKTPEAAVAAPEPAKPPKSAPAWPEKEIQPVAGRAVKRQH